MGGAGLGLPMIAGGARLGLMPHAGRCRALLPGMGALGSACPRLLAGMRASHLPLVRLGLLTGMLLACPSFRPAARLLMRVGLCFGMAPNLDGVLRLRPMRLLLARMGLSDIASMGARLGPVALATHRLSHLIAARPFGALLPSLLASTAFRRLLRLMAARLLGPLLVVSAFGGAGVVLALLLLRGARAALGDAFGADVLVVEVRRGAVLAAAAPGGVADGRLVTGVPFVTPVAHLPLDGIAASGVVAPVVTAVTLDRIAAMIPLARRDPAVMTMARGAVERAGAGVIARGGDPLGAGAAKRDRPAAGAVHRDQRAAGVGIAVIGIAHVIRRVGAGRVVIIAIAVVDRLDEGFVAVARLPRPRFDATGSVEIIIGRSVADHRVERRGAIGIGVSRAPGRRGERQRTGGRKRADRRRGGERRRGGIAHRNGIGERRQRRGVGLRGGGFRLGLLALLLRRACREQRRQSQRRSAAGPHAPHPAKEGVSSHARMLKRGH